MTLYANSLLRRKICVKCQSLLSEKKKKKIKLSSAERKITLASLKTGDYSQGNKMLTYCEHFPLKSSPKFQCFKYKVYRSCPSPSTPPPPHPPLQHTPCEKLRQFFEAYPFTLMFYMTTESYSTEVRWKINIHPRSRPARISPSASPHTPCCVSRALDWPGYKHGFWPF